MYYFVENDVIKAGPYPRPQNINGKIWPHDGHGNTTASPEELEEAGWLPQVDIKPDFDLDTQVREGPVVAVEATRVTRTWAVRAMTAEELAAWDRAQALKELAGTDIILARILEDALGVLKTQHGIDIEANLPAEAKVKLDARRVARSKL